VADYNPGLKVLFIGKKWDVPFQVEVCEKINQLMGQIAGFQPDVIVSSEFMPGALKVADFGLRKRWVHLDPKANAKEVGQRIEALYAANLWGTHADEILNPLMSVYTPTYNTGDFLRDTYQSLRDQSYPNWEWVVVDDNSSDGTWERLAGVASEDHRVRIYRSTGTGKIGAAKDLATRLCRGVYLVELDHDDMLTDTALEEVKNAFEKDPEVGMVYSNCAAFFQDGTPHHYQGTFWEKRYRKTEYRGKICEECINPDIYDRFGPEYWHQFGWFLMVGPNHLRAYRAEQFRQLGGYNPNLSVADDWDLYARFFLRSKCRHVDKMLYLYRFLDNFGNTTYSWNDKIQYHLKLGQIHYSKEFEAFNRKRLAERPKSPAAGLSGVMLDKNTNGERAQGNPPAKATKLEDRISQMFARFRGIFLNPTAKSRDTDEGKENKTAS
jgi:O-antigen biosynthesis protein